MFSKFRKISAVPDLPTKIDPVLGPIFNEGWFWWGRTNFPPYAEVLEVIIPAKGMGPEPWHHTIYRQILDGYPEMLGEIIRAASQIVSDELPPQLRDRYLEQTPEELREAFLLETITLPENENGSWEITYSNRVSGQNYTVTIEDWNVIGVQNVS